MEAWIRFPAPASTHPSSKVAHEQIELSGDTSQSIPEPPVQLVTRVPCVPPFPPTTQFLPIA